MEPDPEDVGKSQLVVDFHQTDSGFRVPQSDRFSDLGRKIDQLLHRATEYLRNTSCSFQQPEEIHR